MPERQSPPSGAAPIPPSTYEPEGDVVTQSEACTLTLVLHFPDDAARQAWIDRHRAVLDAENAKYATGGAS